MGQEIRYLTSCRKFAKLLNNSYAIWQGTRNEYNYVSKTKKLLKTIAMNTFTYKKLNNTHGQFWGFLAIVPLSAHILPPLFIRGGFNCIWNMAKSYKWKKDKIFKAYGGYKCSCCGEIEELFLTIDHIDESGAKHRRQMKKEKTYFYKWLLDNNFPPGFQVLCFNCNSGKGLNWRKNGIAECPHKNKIVAG